MREKWVDNAKGIAILLVIIGHVSGGLEGMWDFKFVYGVHLVMFFVLSGYTLKKRKITREFVNQKFARLMLPYFYTCLAIIIADVFNSYYLNQDSSINTISNILGRDLLRSFFASGTYRTFGGIELGTRIGAIWFLPAILFAIIIFEILLNCIIDNRSVGIISGIIALLGYLSAQFIWFPFSIQSGMMACFFLWIGYVIKQQKLLDNIRWYHYIIAQLVLLFGIFNNYCNIDFATADISDIFISIPVGLSGCLLIYFISKMDLKGRVFESIGKLSLTVLCTHLFALETMGSYFYGILNKIGLEGNSKIWALILLEVFFAVISAFAIEIIKKKICSVKEKLRQKPWKRNLDIYNERDTEVNVAMGIFVILMLIGYFKISSMLKNIIYSCHIIAFIVFLGYYYKKNQNIWNAVKQNIHSYILPYVLFVMGFLLLNYQHINYGFKETFIRFLLGISFSQAIFDNTLSVGPVYSILMIFVIQLIYIFIDHIIKNETYKVLAIVCISIFGMMLGRNGFWMPWSIDISCYALVFYLIGIYIKKYDLLSKVKDYHISYFILTPIWVYMIYAGSMEVAVRKYGQYGLVIIGSLAGVLLIYKLAAYIADTFSVLRKILELTGRSYIAVIIVHTLVGRKIYNLVSYGFDSEGILYLVCSVLLQIILSGAIVEVLYWLKYKVSNPIR